MAQQLPALPYAYNALEPHIDEQTVRLHHDIHHNGYVVGLNTTLDKLAKARETGDHGEPETLSELRELRIGDGQLRRQFRSKRGEIHGSGLCCAPRHRSPSPPGSTLRTRGQPAPDTTDPSPRLPQSGSSQLKRVPCSGEV